MCLAIPGKIVAINSSNPDLKMAKVSFGGILKDICIEWLPDVEEGDYVMAHAGTALNKVNEAEAEETIQIFRQWTDGLDTRDTKSEEIA